MNPGHWRQPKIIRLLAAASLLALGSRPTGAEAQNVSCVPCLVIGVDATSLNTTGELAPSSLTGVRVLVMARPEDETTRQAVPLLAAAGASIGVTVTPGALVRDEILRQITFVVVQPAPAVSSEPASGSTALELSFAARTTITALRAERPDLEVVVDGDAFAAAGAALESIAPYVEAEVRSPAAFAALPVRPAEQGPAPQPLGIARWLRLPSRVSPTVDDLVAASLAPGSERVLLPVQAVDWRAVQEFVSRRATIVDVGGTRSLTVEEIVARYQAQQRRQDEIVRTTIASGTTTLLIEVPGFAAPVTITAETTTFQGGGETDFEERDIRVNGAAIAGGGAQSPPELPLLEAERIGTPPLIITLNEAYRYALDGVEAIDGSRCYIVRFEPRSPGRGFARGRAWINATDFALRRLDTVQSDLRGAIVSSEQIDDFGRVDVSGDPVWLPMETHVFQAYEGAGFRTPIHRTISVARYEVNSAAFDARLRAALASDSVMLRETPAGLRYLVRREGGNGRVVEPTAGHSIRSLIGGVLIDPNITAPLPFAGISYVNLNLFNRGAQLNVFFGGVYGQAWWSVPSIAGSRWQAHGSAFGIAARYSDRVFRDGREQYSENLLQRPAYVSAGVLRALTPRVRATLDYELTVTTLRPGASTDGLFRVPPDVINHGAMIAVDAERGGWSVRGWWNPARRQRWTPWGLGLFDPATSDYQRYGAQINRTLALRAAISSRVQAAWMAGHDLDRFSRYGVDSFDNPLHGYPTASIRYDRGAVIRSATSWSGRGWRLDGFGDIALVRDPGWGSQMRSYPGVGAGLESAGPLRMLWSFEWGYGFQARRLDGGRGTQTARITVYKGF